MKREITKMRKHTNNTMNNTNKNVLPARILSAAMAAFALLTAVPAVSMMPVHAAEIDEFNDSEDNNDSYDVYIEYSDDCDDDCGGHDTYYEIYEYDEDTNYFDELNDLRSVQGDSYGFASTQKTNPSIAGGNYAPGQTITNDSNDDICIWFSGSNGSEYHFTLAPNQSFTIPQSYSSSISTNYLWNCDVDTQHRIYYFTAVNKSTPSQTQPQTQKQEQPKHVCNMEWVTVKEPTKKSDGLSQYRCKSCGRVEMEVPINAATTYIQELYTAIDKAPANGTVVYNADDYYTISKYVLQKMAMRNDVTVSIQFNYKNVPYVIVFPAKTDYTKLLQSKDNFFGFLGLNGYNGKVAVAKR